MKQLTIKELAPYLPYGLKLKSDHKILQLIGLQGQLILLDDNTDCVSSMINELYWKPILRPLSELTKPITHNNETFVPIERLEQGENGSTYREYSSTPNELTLSITYKLMGETFTDIVINRNSVDSTKYEYVQKLLEWHFDIFSLLENNLAIDITTLK